MTPAVDSWVDNARRAAVITTSFDHPAEVVWSLFADPDKLARWWGPPGAPMTIERHDLRPGGAVELTVTTGGTRIRGRWDIHEVAAPHGLGFTFSSDGLDPTEITVEIGAGSAGSTTLTITARFATDDHWRHALRIGFVDGVARSCTTAHEAIDAGGGPRPSGL
jgi:uncharacterized protein YndB with AHSA1/START domain